MRIGRRTKRIERRIRRIERRIRGIKRRIKRTERRIKKTERRIERSMRRIERGIRRIERRIRRIERRMRRIEKRMRIERRIKRRVKRTIRGVRAHLHWQLFVCKLCLQTKVDSVDGPEIVAAMFRKYCGNIAGNVCKLLLLQCRRRQKVAATCLQTSKKNRNGSIFPKSFQTFCCQRLP